eukprot:gene10962-12123_t
MTEEVAQFAASGTSTSKSVKGRMQVSLLDDTVVAFDVESKAKGEQLYKVVNSHLKVEEAEYFGLQYYDSEGNVCWLDSQKQIKKQVKEPSKITFKYRVMFYTPDPNTLQEYTRYLFTLQIRRDLLDERLHCSDDTVALLASYIVQGELGDYDPATHIEGYLSGFQFIPNQSQEVEDKIIKYHASHRGKSPSEADRNMLDVARQLDMYGVTLYPAKDRDDTDLSLSVFHMGVLGKHSKVEFQEEEVYSADLVEFTMQSRDACKGFWKICIAHHVFFRQRSVPQAPRRTSLISRGSKYRYSGRTQKQLVEESRETYRPDDLERNRSSRSHANNDVELPAPSASEDRKASQTPPPSYSSLKQFSNPTTTTPPPNPHSSSTKVSIAGSEDEGSFILHEGSRKSSQQLEFDAEFDGGGIGFAEQSFIKIQRQDTIEDAPLQNAIVPTDASEGDPKGLEKDDELHNGMQERTESDLEISRQVHSLLDQIKGETGWQYHIATSDLDEHHEVHESTNVQVQQNGHAHVTDENKIVNEEETRVAVNPSLVFAVNGDMNANETDDVISYEEQAISNGKDILSVDVRESTSRGNGTNNALILPPFHRLHLRPTCFCQWNQGTLKMEVTVFGLHQRSGENKSDW